MQTSNTGSVPATPIGLETRFNAVRAFFIDRGVRHYMSVFAAFGLAVDDRKDYITALWNGRARMNPGDEALLLDFEHVVERLKREPKAAA